MTHLKLRSYLFICSSIFVLLLTVAVVTIYSRVARHNSIMSLEDYGKSMAANLAFTSVDYFIEENYTALQEFAEYFVENVDVGNVSITDADGFILADSQIEKIGKSITANGTDSLSPDDHLANFKNQKTISTKVFDSQEIVVVFAPIWFQDELYGFAKIDLSMAHMNEHLADIKRQVATLGLLFFIAGLVISMIVSRSISLPLQRMMAVTDRISKGTFQQEEVEPGIQELEKLSQALNTMAEAIENREKELKSTNADLEQSNKILNRLIDESPFGIMMINSDKIIFRINEAGSKIFGRSREEIENHKCYQFVCPKEKNNCPIWDLNVTLDKKETTCLKPDGESSPIIKSAIKIDDFLLEMFVDITEQKEAENALRQLSASLEEKVEERTKELTETHRELEQTQAQILQQEKMASIGQLAAGVAHEINNPMGFIASNINSLKKYSSRLLDFIDQQSEIIDDIAVDETKENLAKLRKKQKIDLITEDVNDLIAESLDGAERVKEIVQNLKSFARLDLDKDVEANLNECLESTINIVWNELKYTAELIREYGELPLIKCRPHELNQVFMNLLVNASQAIKDQGTITVKTWSSEKGVHVAVTDTGSGISNENMKRLFEPFFTTKDVGKGTGLGLSISYDIVKKHNGTIEVQSEEGKGTTFTVTIPSLVETLQE